MSTHTAEHPAHLAHHFDDAQQQYVSASLGMWVFLATEVMFFGGMFGGYLVYRYLYGAAFQEGSSHLDFWAGTVNTFVLLLSSLTVALSVHAAQTGHQRKLIGLLVATIVLGAVFLGIKAYEYRHKYEEGLVPGSGFSLSEPTYARVVAAGDTTFEAGRWVRTAEVEQVNAEIEQTGGTPAEYAHVNEKRAQIFFGFYFAMTGFHALHMVIGVGLFAVIAMMAARGRFSAEYSTPVEISGLYWHFVDIVWVFLYPLLYLIAA